jgi:Ca-activated chloride channel family protein
MFIPEPDTMRLRNKTVLGALVFCLLHVTLWQGVAGQDQPKRSDQQNAQQNVQPSTLPADIDPADPAVPVWMRPARKATPSNNSSAVPAANVPTNPPPNSVGEVTKDRSGFVIRTRVDEVSLGVTVVDQKQHLVTTLGQNDFLVYEDEQQQKVTMFRREDIPVSIAIVVDNSGSMREKRAAVTKAVVNLVKASNPHDEVFIVNFNDEPYLDQDFTNDISLMREALDRLDSRGGTALYDAVIAAADHLAKGAKLEKKVLLVITDGEDNESRTSLEQAIRAVQNDNGPTIYSIGILGSEGRERRAKRALESLSLQTGGLAFFPKNLEEVDVVSQQVAHDIRNGYTITYKPSNPQTNGGYRKVKVMVRASGYKDLQVRTKSGYFAGQNAPASAGR